MPKLNLRDRVLALHGRFLNRSYSRLWNSLARADARQAILSVEDPEEFEKSAIRDAERLKTNIQNDTIVLNLGCGIGRVEKYFASYCKELHGADISRTMLQLASQRLQGIQNVSLHLLRDVSLGIFSNEKFDAVFSLLVLQHLEYEDAFRYMLEFNRVLKPQGTCILQFPNMKNENYFSAFKQFCSQKYQHRSLGRTRLYTEEEVTIKLSRAGFKILELNTDGADIVAVSEKATVVQEIKEMDDAEIKRQRVLRAKLNH